MNRQLIYIFFLTSFVLQFHVAVSACCEIYQQNQCPTLWTAYKDHCYRFFGQAVTWEEAESKCRMFGSPNGLGTAYILTLHCAQEEEFVMNYVESSSEPETTIWLGYNDKKKEGTYEWVDGQRANYVNWKSNQPDNYGKGEDCASLVLKKKNWNDLPCNDSKFKYTFICKMRRV